MYLIKLNNGMMYLVCCDEKLLCEEDLLDFLLEDNVDKGWSHTTAKL